MGIENFIARVATQTAVYWGTPVEDGHGSRTFADPVEISCRWEDRVEKISRVGTGGRLGEELNSTARVFVTQDVDEQGWLYLGDLDDLDSDEEADPETADGAYEIQRFDKSPVLGATNKFIRTAYL